MIQVKVSRGTFTQIWMASLSEKTMSSYVEASDSVQNSAVCISANLYLSIILQISNTHKTDGRCN